MHCLNTRRSFQWCNLGSELCFCFVFFFLLWEVPEWGMRILLKLVYKQVFTLIWVIVPIACLGNVTQQEWSQTSRLFQVKQVCEFILTAPFSCGDWGVSTFCSTDYLDSFCGTEHIHLCSVCKLKSLAYCTLYFRSVLPFNSSLLAPTDFVFCSLRCNI